MEMTEDPEMSSPSFISLLLSLSQLNLDDDGDDVDHILQARCVDF